MENTGISRSRAGGWVRRFAFGLFGAIASTAAALLLIAAALTASGVLEW